MKESERSIIRESRFETDNNNRIYIAVKLNHKSGLNHRGGMVYELPDRGERNAFSMSFNYNIVGCPGRDYRLSAVGYDASWSPVTAATFDADDAGATGSHTLTFGANVVKCAFLWSVADTTEHIYCGDDTGDGGYAIVTNIRIKSQTGDILASDIAGALYDYIAAANSGQLAGKLITATTADLQDEVYEDNYPFDILDRLATVSAYSWRVDNRGLFIWQPNSDDAARSWIATIDLSTFELEEDLGNLYNSAYGRYSDANGRALRTTTANNALDVEKWGITRRQKVEARTTSATQAGLFRDAFLGDAPARAIRSGVTVIRLRDAGGGQQPLYAPRPGDLITVDNLPAALSPDIDAIRVFRLGYLEYNGRSRSARYEPVTPPATLATLIAQKEVGL
jgi:hypothetical protein